MTSGSAPIHSPAVTININVIHSNLHDHEILMKLSELSGAVAALNTKADTINAKIDAFLPGAGDPPLPADAETGLTTLSEKLTVIEGKIPPPAA